ncbi:adaptin ear-binding coat-associated protein 2 [Hirsutella rhossiliensis]|uniref:Adaptin ear-binding coat-associated protein 2 n=1 Tax=Hirsutella rhossiliensis TaxID=111463 RepID=A0A9P8SFQ2_9HYPO|nr:adaptin ear-binding coat-associated protein 2 [Hirsutella rhossiliensis]KAH0960991.1 adaptin ear-binding coat-associated protein 2 [Hirsutella rhossiliensis]
MELLDPATGRPLPADAIQRVLFLASAVHVYNIPPLPSMRGHSAASWTADPSRHIFTARLRVVETALSSTSSSSSDDAAAASGLKVDVVLEDPSSAQLFAAAPYTDRAAVEPVLDSSRFFAVTVRDQDGRKAVLGIGFEERSDAFDLAVALQEARRSLGWEAKQHSTRDPAAAAKENVKDYSLKDGETITVNIGKSMLGRRRPQPQQVDETPAADMQSFALPPPPSAKPSDSGGAFALPPPPSAQDVKRKRRSLRDMGFDDGQFGEFA